MPGILDKVVTSILMQNPIHRQALKGTTSVLGNTPAQTGLTLGRGLLDTTPAGDFLAMGEGIRDRDPLGFGLGALSLALPGTIRPLKSGRGVADASGVVKPLTESQFFSRYAQHIDLRSRGKKEAGAIAEDIKKTGFKKGANVNALPPSRGGPPMNIIDRNFAPKKGDYVYLAPPEAWKDAPNGIQVQDGWIPQDFEVIRVEADNPNMYQEYLKSVAKHNKKAAKAIK